VRLEVRQLIREMSLANPLWGAPRIHGEVLKLGIDVGQTSVAKYMARDRRPPSQGWRRIRLPNGSPSKSRRHVVGRARHTISSVIGTGSTEGHLRAGSGRWAFATDRRTFYTARTQRVLVICQPAFSDGVPDEDIAGLVVFGIYVMEGSS